MPPLLPTTDQYPHPVLKPLPLLQANIFVYPYAITQRNPDTETRILCVFMLPLGEVFDDGCVFNSIGKYSNLRCLSSYTEIYQLSKEP